MSAISFNTANQTFRQLLGNGLSYRVPRFQRDYSWTQDEWDDLWQDIRSVLDGDSEPDHYMGYLVLQTADNKTFDVIDGQQRLTTLSLLVLAVLKCLEELASEGVDPESNRRRLEQLRSTYIGYLDPVSLIPRSKLTLNRNNDGYYADYLVPLQRLPQRGLRTSEHLLRKAFEWLLQRVRKDYASGRDGATLALFLDRLSDKLFFTVVQVTDELNAFRVFETLNSRGVRLSPTDLLKNYLFSVVSRETQHEQEIETLERRWESMVGRLGGESFPDFLRVHWNSRRPFIREAELFKRIRSETPDKARVFALLREMEEDVEIYVALGNPEDAVWTEAQRQHVRDLRMFSVRGPWPLLLAAHRAFDTEGWLGILRACSVISFRYNVIGSLATNEQERVYNRVAQRIAAGELAGAPEAIRALEPIYVSDENFRAAFSNKVLRTTSTRNKRVARYILAMIETRESGAQYDVESPRYSIEHILPESPDRGWSTFPERDQEEFTYRLGNLTLLEADANRRIGNGDYATKREAYAASDFATTRSIAEGYDLWDAEKLAHRQAWMARQATAIWRLSQFD